MQQFSLLKTLLATLACTAALSAQHTVTFSVNWVHNGTIFTVPQNNTDQQAVPGGIAFARAQANYYSASLNGHANMTMANTVRASTSASGGARGDYTYVGLPNGAVQVTGSHSAGGTATAAGNVSGSSFAVSAAYSNSIGVSANSGASWGGAGPVLSTTPGSFSTGLAIAVAFSWNSSSASSIKVKARGAGSSVQVSGRARVDSQTTLF